MKLNKIFLKYISGALLAVAAVILTGLTSCVDDTLDFGQGGETVTLRLKVDLPSMNVITRSDITGGLDQHIESLWIGVYKAVGDGARTGFIEVQDPVSEEHNNSIADVEMRAMTGTSYIVAVANYNNRYATDAHGNEVSLAEALQQADTWKKFHDLSVMWNSEGNILTDVPVNPLLMSGHYIEGSHADGSYTELQPVEIPRSGVLKGKVHLRRLVSQVRFNVTYNTDNISEFEVLGWTVYNVPNQCWLSERSYGTVNSGDIRTAASGSPSYQNTVESSIISKDDNKWSFDWWQIENKRTGLTPPASITDPYQYRELEHKDESGANTGKYASLVESATSDDPNNNATYVAFKVRMTLKVDEKGNSIEGSQVRIFDGVYTVHLGYCEGSGIAKAMDFNVRRNTRYTYNVTVNNVGDIMVEADSDVENAPGAEGIVSDVTEKFVSLDAHYGVYNIYLSKSDLEVFDYLIRCYDESSARVLIDSKDPSTIPAASSPLRKYLDWVEIRKTTDANTLALYKPASDSGTYRLDEFKAGIEKGTLTEGYYTVFFNEYAYETNKEGDESSSTSWRGYVNKPDRQVWIRVLEHKSSDGESSYFQSKYAFSQKSIQTYYSVNANGSESALGVEHVNESYGLNLRTSTLSGQNANDGRYNTAKYIRSSWSDYIRWTSFIQPTVAQSVNAINNIQGVTRSAVTHALPALVAYTGATANSFDPDQTSSRKYINARNACMNRNRDLDGDSYIDPGELRWYVPTSNQILCIILGRRSLVTPIMDFAANDPLASETTGNLPSLIVFGSDYKVNWVMECMSTGPYGSWYSGHPWNVRCVRNLGSDMTDTSFTTTVPTAFKKREGATNTVEMTYYDGRSIRTDKMAVMQPHNLADQDFNRAYKAFEYSNELEMGDLNGYATYHDDWANWLREVNPCSGVSGLTGTGWRIPNQKEITIMAMIGVYPSVYGYSPSATFQYYDNRGKGVKSNSDLNINDFKIMCTTNSGNGTQQSYSEFNKSATKVRCVRDVD